MNPVTKYFLARLGLFAAVAAPLSFVINVLLALLIGLLVSMLVSMLMLKGMRTEMIDYIDANAQRRRAEKQRLRDELNGGPKSSAGADGAADQQDADESAGVEAEAERDKSEAN